MTLSFQVSVPLQVRGLLYSCPSSLASFLGCEGEEARARPGSQESAPIPDSWGRRGREPGEARSSERCCETSLRHGAQGEVTKPWVSTSQTPASTWEEPVGSENCLPLSQGWRKSKGSGCPYSTSRGGVWGCTPTPPSWPTSSADQGKGCGGPAVFPSALRLPSTLRTVLLPAGGIPCLTG